MTGKSHCWVPSFGQPGVEQRCRWPREHAIAITRPFESKTVRQWLGTFGPLSPQLEPRVRDQRGRFGDAIDVEHGPVGYAHERVE